MKMPIERAIATIFVSAVLNFMNQFPDIYSGKQKFTDGLISALQNTEVSFLQSNLLDEALKDIPTGLGRMALKTAFATCYQAGTNALVKIVEAIYEILSSIQR